MPQNTKISKGWAMVKRLWVGRLSTVSTYCFTYFPQLFNNCPDLPIVLVVPVKSLAVINFFYNTDKIKRIDKKDK